MPENCTPRHLFGIEMGPEELASELDKAEIRRQLLSSTKVVTKLAAKLGIDVSKEASAIAEAVKGG